MSKAASPKPEKPQPKTPQLLSKIPHPMDDLIKAEPKMDAKLRQLDVCKLSKLRRISRLEREFTGQEDW